MNVFMIFKHGMQFSFHVATLTHVSWIACYFKDVIKIINNYSGWRWYICLVSSFFVSWKIRSWILTWKVLERKRYSTVWGITFTFEGGEKKICEGFQLLSSFLTDIRNNCPHKSKQQTCDIMFMTNRYFRWSHELKLNLLAFTISMWSIYPKVSGLSR
jgi:hypothetical protein